MRKFILQINRQCPKRLTKNRNRRNQKKIWNIWSNQPTHPLYFVPTLINRVKYIKMPYLQYYETYILVSYLFRIVRTRPMHLTTFRVKIRGNFIPTLKNRVRYIISKFHEAYIQLSYLFRIVRTRQMHLTTF